MPNAIVAPTVAILLEGNPKPGSKAVCFHMFRSADVQVALKRLYVFFELVFCQYLAT
jgi:hypothetical protein